MHAPESPAPASRLFRFGHQPEAARGLAGRRHHPTQQRYAASRIERPLSFSGTAHAPHGPGSAPPALRHHAARRHPARGALALGERQGEDRPRARPARRALHRGRVARLQPQGRGVLPADAGIAAGLRADRGVRQHAAGGHPLRGRRQHPGARGGRHAGGDAGGEDVDPARGPGAGDDAGGEPPHGGGQRRLVQAAGPGSDLRRRALLRRLAARPRLRLRHPPGGRRGRRGHAGAVRYQRRRAARDRRRAGARAARAAGHAARHPSAQRCRARGGQRARRGPGRLRAGAGHHQRLRRALRQPRPGAVDRHAPAQARAAGRQRRGAASG